MRNMGGEMTIRNKINHPNLKGKVGEEMGEMCKFDILEGL